MDVERVVCAQRRDLEVSSRAPDGQIAWVACLDDISVALLYEFIVLLIPIGERLEGDHGGVGVILVRGVLSRRECAVDPVVLLDRMTGGRDGQFIHITNSNFSTTLEYSVDSKEVTYVINLDKILVEMSAVRGVVGE